MRRKCVPTSCVCSGIRIRIEFVIREQGGSGFDAEPATGSTTAATQPSERHARKLYITLAACVALLAACFAAYYFWPRTNTPSGPAKITQISQWNKPLNDARLSPDGHAVAFVSPVGGITQVFLMLTSGGEPLQLTNDEGDKDIDSFSPDGKEIYYQKYLGRDEIWAVPTLGGSSPALWYLRDGWFLLRMALSFFMRSRKAPEYFVQGNPD